MCAMSADAASKAQGGRKMKWLAGSSEFVSEQLQEHRARGTEFQISGDMTMTLQAPNAV